MISQEFLHFTRKSLGLGTFLFAVRRCYGKLIFSWIVCGRAVEHVPF